MSPRARGPRRPSTRRAEPALPPGARVLAPRELRWTCAPRELRRPLAAAAAAARAEEAAAARTAARTTRRRRASASPPVALEELVGQADAVEAICAGLATDAPGFHVFVVGPPGSGREALVRAATAHVHPPLPPPRDVVYVVDPRGAERPRALTFPRGKGRKFLRDLDRALDALRRSIPAALEREEVVGRCERLRRRWEGRAARLLDDLAAALRPHGLLLGPVPDGFATPELLVEVERGRASLELTPRQVERRLARGALRRTRALGARLALVPEARRELEAAGAAARALVERGARAARKVEASVARALARGFFDDLARAYPSRGLRRWLRLALAALADRLDDLVEEHRRGRDRDPGGADDRRGDADPLADLRGRLFVDARELPARPVVFEPAPTAVNLFGGVDGGDGPEHLRLRAGSLLRANGGVLVVDAGELVQDPAAWRAVKRAARTGWIEVQRAASASGSSLRPRPVRARFKLVAIGTPDVWGQLTAADPEAAEVFKVKVALDDLWPNEPPVRVEVACALARTARRAGLPTPDAGAVARLLEHAARLAGRQDKLLPCFSELLDVLHEAARAGARGAGARAADVERALARRRRRVDLEERRLAEETALGFVLLEVDGMRAGVVNALVVHDTGDHAFGRPCRVTAAVGVGRRGLVDVEREARMSGDLHHKGVQLLAGLLRERYAQDKPLALTATIAFEQSYELVDGDSASLAEALAVLSALADAPLRQDLAVTGSINQKGDVQPVGDATLKVEGFYDACRARGLTGRQGVLLPAANARDLMLREDVVAAVAAGTFHVLVVQTLDDALVLMTGLPAGERAAPGRPYPRGSVHARVDDRLAAYAEASARTQAR